MPLFDYLCERCKITEERIAKVDEHIVTCSCGGTMARQFHGRYGINMGVGAYGYFDDSLNTYINSNEHRRRVMKEQGVQEAYGRKGWR
jgi:putative FmdB family regulatory protein